MKVNEGVVGKVPNIYHMRSWAWPFLCAALLVISPHLCKGKSDGDIRLIVLWLEKTEIVTLETPITVPNGQKITKALQVGILMKGKNLLKEFRVARIEAQLVDTERNKIWESLKSSVEQIEKGSAVGSSLQKHELLRFSLLFLPPEPGVKPLTLAVVIHLYRMRSSTTVTFENIRKQELPISKEVNAIKFTLQSFGYQVGGVEGLKELAGRHFVVNMRMDKDFVETWDEPPLSFDLLKLVDKEGKEFVHRMARIKENKVFDSKTSRISRDYQISYHFAPDQNISEISQLVIMVQKQQVEIIDTTFTIIPPK